MTTVTTSSRVDLTRVRPTTRAPRAGMELDATRVSDGATLDADVCIVGAGPAGLVLARELVARGLVVVLLESGGHADAPLDADADARADAHADAHADALNDGDVAGDAYAGLRATRARGVGGTASRWNTPLDDGPGAKWVPLDPVDVDGRWPIAYDALLPYYVRAQRTAGLGPFAYDAAAWAAPGRMPFDHAVRLSSRGSTSSARAAASSIPR